ncbi:Dpy-30-domain-containing protein [Rostrohypoxylon terebratum]|nr:Dpy-30-domain-containing protein [Rostrohypoxylon terebratum]
MSNTNEPPSTAVEDPSSGTAAVPAPIAEAAASPSAPSGAAAAQITTAGGPQTPTNAPSPAARTGTPLRTVANGQEGNAANANTSNSRAASQHPDTGFTMPSEAPPHGAPVRQYLNTKVTGPLLDGMKLLAKNKPQDPLRVLGEYLIQRSKELETSSGST